MVEIHEFHTSHVVTLRVKFMNFLKMWLKNSVPYPLNVEDVHQ
jgi:hypothetical protein